MSECWVTAHIIDEPLKVEGDEMFVEIAQSTLDEVQPLGVQAVMVTYAPGASGYDSAHQTMVMLELDPQKVPQGEPLLARKRAAEAVEWLQHFGVAPAGKAETVAAEFGDSMIKTMTDEGGQL